MKSLPTITLVCLNCVDPSLGVKALKYSMRKIKFARVLLIAHEKPSNITEDIEYIEIEKLTHDGSCVFMLKRLNQYIDTEFCLSIHDDGFITNPHLWRNEFLDYDYIGAPWESGYVGNGGFTLRSKKFMELCSDIPHNGEHDDWHVCVTHKEYFESNGCKYAPTDLAVKFSLEGMVPGYEYDLNNCFGFHGRGEVQYLFGDKGQQFKDNIALLDKMGRGSLQINLFCSKISRFSFTTKMVDEIFKIKDKSNIKLCIYGEESNINLWSEYFTSNKPSFKVDLVLFESGHYPLKVDHAHKTTCKYSCKMDDDILMSHNVWEFILDNLSSISDSHPVISPIFTNGIPSTDMFVDDFLSEDDRKIAHRHFLAGGINGGEWGLNCNNINNNIAMMTEWSGQKYWDMVSKVDTEWDTRNLPWYYYMVRGLHPARYSRDYNIFIADKIIENKEKFFGKHDYRLEEYNAPYFCNNLFFCETDFWRESFRLFNDGWDEGQLTLKMDLEKSSPLYVRNGFAIHMAYGMTRSQQEIEHYYTNNI